GLMSFLGLAVMLCLLVVNFCLSHHIHKRCDSHLDLELGVDSHHLGKIFLVLPFDMLVGIRLRDKRYVRYFDKFAGTAVIDIRL
ncbi:hypothetical protein MUP79_04090, partial [Candidatus Bathyarchaeota archaeon]|nr:hypothetical protein [Candidatus Bathyarchaeota archaeon]